MRRQRRKNTSSWRECSTELYRLRTATNTAIFYSRCLSRRRDLQLGLVHTINNKFSRLNRPPSTSPNIFTIFSSSEDPNRPSLLRTKRMRESNKRKRSTNSSKYLTDLAPARMQILTNGYLYHILARNRVELVCFG